MNMTQDTRAAIADAAWAVGLRLGAFGYAEISAECHISMKRASELVQGWLVDGKCELTQSGVGLRKMFRLLPDHVRRVPLHMKGSVPLNLWTAMRGLKSFTPTDLAAHSTTDAVQVTVAAAQAYCQTLLRASYLKVERTAIPGRREAIYRLIRATGPRPPRERRVRAVYDENLDQIVHVSGGSK